MQGIDNVKIRKSQENMHIRGVGKCNEWKMRKKYLHIHSCVLYICSELSFVSTYAAPRVALRGERSLALAETRRTSASDY